jgi:hypothetical protein
MHVASLEWNCEYQSHKQLQDDDGPTYLPGIGTIATSWVGRKGQKQLVQSYSKLLETEELNSTMYWPANMMTRTL